MTELPDHAVEEIKAAKGSRRAELKAFWSGWAAIGDAKQARREALDALVAAETRLHGAPRSHRAAQIVKVKAAEQAVVQADAAIERAVLEHKAAR